MGSDKRNRLKFTWTVFLMNFSVLLFLKYVGIFENIGRKSIIDKEYFDRNVNESNPNQERFECKN